MVSTENLLRSLLRGGIILLCLSGAALGADHSLRVVNTFPEYGSEIPPHSEFAIVIGFNREVDHAIIEDFVMDQRGAVDEDGEPIEIPGEFAWLDAKTLQFTPKERLKPAATYQVSLYSARTREGEEMDGLPFRLAFKTSEE